MAFRGKEWVPPVAEEVATFIQDRLSLTELSVESLKEVLSHAQFEVATQGPTIDEDSVREAASAEVNANLRLVNATYYENIKKLAPTMGAGEVVNIVLPVYNSLHLTRECIAAVVKNTFWPYHLTIVDDAGDKHTNDELTKIVAEHPEMTLLTNRKNRGFSATVNRGVKNYEAKSKYTCYLNSDVLVTPYWLTKMILALNADPRNKIVNPATNNTAVINVNMSPGYSYQTMNECLEATAVRKYPEIMPTGFCFLFANSLLKTVGYLDEGYQNFGEETDFWMRTITWSNGETFDRWRAVLADDTYVFHQRGASYATLGEEQHMNFRKMASGRFRQNWPSWGTWNKAIGVKAIEPVRRSHGPKELAAATLKAKKPSIAFVTYSVDPCGGMHYIADIVNHINSIGGDARVVHILRDGKPSGEAVGELRSAPIEFKNVEDFNALFTTKVFAAGAVIAATAELAKPVANLCEVNPLLIPILHVQSYEPALVPPGDAEMTKVVEGFFSHIPTVISSSSWITKELQSLPEFSGEVISTINPGVDKDIFYSGDRALGDDRLTVMVVTNGQYPFKGSDRGIAFAQTLAGMVHKNGKEVRILAVGADAIAGAPTILCQGKVARTRLARLLATEVDLFVDPALNHSYGMPALEAIACGVPVIGWDNRGIREYLPKGYAIEDVILPNDTYPQKLAQLAFQILFSEQNVLSTIIQVQRKVALIQAHDRKQSVARFAQCIYDCFGARVTRKKIVVVTPHMRKHGGPTTIITIANELAKKGHDVSIAVVYSDLNPEVIRYTDLPIILIGQDATKIPECDLLITNSDNPLNPSFSQLCPQVKKTIMLKLSHNPRFKQLEEQGLNCKWDAVVTSSQWLANVCENPTPDWNYKPVKATRIGWFHYNFERMRRNPKRKKVRQLSFQDPVVLTTLIHAHPTKGSADAGNIFAALKKAHGDKIKLIGVGEIPPADVKLQLPGMEYVCQPNRDEMADLMFKTDIWLGCSHGEGLGRLALEAMTGSAACVLTDTNAEFVVHGENALVAPVEDLSALANHVNTLITNIDERKKIAIGGFATAKAMADPTNLIDSLEKVIYDIF